MNASELKFLVDVGVGKGIEKYLLEGCYDTKAVRDIDSPWRTRISSTLR